MSHLITSMSSVDLNKLVIYFLYGLLVTVSITCAATDLRQRRIPNVLTYPTALTALLAYYVIGGWDGFLFSFSGLIFGFLLFLFPYFMGGMGAGDVKLMSAVGAVLGFQQTAISFLFIAVCGGIMALGFMAYRRNLKHKILNTFLAILNLGMHQDTSLLKVDKDKITQEGIPYGVAITSGVFLFFLYMFMNNKTLLAVQLFEALKR